MNFPQRLKEARARLGLSQKEVAEQSGVSTRGYQGYEDGRSIPGGDAIAGFVRLGINANWLLTGEGPMLLANLSDKRENGYIVDEEREERMSEAVDLVDFVLGSQKRKWPPGKKYELIKAVSDLLDDREETKDRVLRLIKSAA